MLSDGTSQFWDWINEHHPDPGACRECLQFARAMGEDVEREVRDTLAEAEIMPAFAGANGVDFEAVVRGATEYYSHPPGAGSTKSAIGLCWICLDRLDEDGEVYRVNAIDNGTFGKVERWSSGWMGITCGDTYLRDDDAFATREEAVEALIANCTPR